MLALKDRPSGNGDQCSYYTNLRRGGRRYAVICNPVTNPDVLPVYEIVERDNGALGYLLLHTVQGSEVDALLGDQHTLLDGDAEYLVCSLDACGLLD